MHKIISSKPYSTGTVISKDGTSIGYRQLGEGPGLILIHGGMMSSQNFMMLGTFLSDYFTIYIPDRRGRGLSGKAGNDYSIIKECEDIEALLNKTKAHFIFGLSSGAIITMKSASLFPSIQKIAVYEPPLPVNGTQPAAWAPRYEKEIAQGKLEEAMVTVMKGTGDSWSLSKLPRFILVPLLKLGIKADEKEVKPGDVPIKDLIPTMHYDSLLVKEMEGKFDLFKNLKAEVLLLGGNRSNVFLKTALTALKKTLPQSHYVQFSGVGHLAANNDSKPELVAHELKKFFS